VLNKSVQISQNRVSVWNGVEQRNTWNENGTEILKITRDVPKISKSGLKRSAETGELPEAEMPQGYYCR
jgi:hypothetical protein